MKSTHKITATNKLDPLILLASTLTPGGHGIEAMEAAGQKELVESSQLPADGLNGSRFGAKDTYTVKKMLEDAGGKVLHPTDGDPLFVDVVLPKGWTLKPTEHSMWNDLVDEHGRKRAGIFYKAAFYDRNAHIHLTKRFAPTTHTPDYSANPRNNIAVILDQDGATVWSGKEMTGGYEVTDELNAIAQAKLELAYPEWKDASKYWDVMTPVFPA